MLDMAIKYQEEVKACFRNTWLDDRYKFYHAANFHEDIQLHESTWVNHEFVSVADGKVIGFLGYQLDRSSDYAYGLNIINFAGAANPVFSMDLGIFLRNIFEKYAIRRVEWSVVIGNPIEKSYDRICEKYGGRIVGTYFKRTRLIDGKFYDEKFYELSRESYLASRAGGNSGSKEKIGRGGGY